MKKIITILIIFIVAIPTFAIESDINNNTNGSGGSDSRNVLTEYDKKNDEAIQRYIHKKEIEGDIDLIKKNKDVTLKYLNTLRNFESKEKSVVLSNQQGEERDVREVNKVINNEEYNIQENNNLYNGGIEQKEVLERKKENYFLIIFSLINFILIIYILFKLRKL